MTMEGYWAQHRESFLASARQAQDDQQLLSCYRMLMEQMKMEALAQFPHEDVMRQQTALLFYEAMQGAEMLLAKGEPVVVKGKEKAGPRGGVRLLKRPETSYVILGAGLVMSVLGGRACWQLAPLFAVALLLLELKRRDAGSADDTDGRAVSPLRVEYLDGFIDRQAKLLDQHIADLRLLLQDSLSPVQEASLESSTQQLCQYVWACANGEYPAETALDAAQRTLQQNDMAWLEYTPEKQAWFDVMPTQRQSCMVYPALCRLSDGTLVRKGQYIEGVQRQEEEKRK